MQHPLQCRCGTIKGWVSDTENANRAVCYCRDCQAFARFLGQESETLDAQGGSDIVQTLPKNVTFLQGADALACMRLTQKGNGSLVCRLLQNAYWQHVGKLQNLLHRPVAQLLEAPEHPLQDSFGAVRTYANPHGAIGNPKPKAQEWVRQSDGS